jgi:hypothetical protein
MVTARYERQETRSRGRYWREAANFNLMHFGGSIGRVCHFPIGREQEMLPTAHLTKALVAGTRFAAYGYARPKSSPGG